MSIVQVLQSLNKSKSQTNLIQIIIHLFQHVEIWCDNVDEQIALYSLAIFIYVFQMFLTNILNAIILSFSFPT